MNTNAFLNTVASNIFDVTGATTLPSTLYLGLSTSAPNVDGTGVTEPSGNAYARIELTGLELKDGENGVVTNSTALSFPESTGTWGTVTHYVVYDDATSGNLLIYGELTSSRTVESENIMMIKANSLSLSVVNPS